MSKENLPAATGTMLPQYTPMAILAAAVERGADIAQLEKLMDLQERWENREAKKAFDKALAAFKADPPQIDKDHDVKYGNTAYSHASLQNVANKAGKALSQHGLSFSWRTSQNGPTIAVTCVLSHEMGHSIDTTIAAAADTSGSKNSIQAIGSTITYLQRYTLLAITGLATGDMDDDGKSGGDHTDQKKEENKPKSRLDQWLEYVDAFTDKTIDQWNTALDASISPALKKMPEEDRRKMQIAINEMTIHLTEKENGK